MKLFKSRKFEVGKLVDIRLEDPSDPHDIIGGILRLILDKHFFAIGGGSTSGRGMYIAFHSPEDAYEIEKYIKRRVKEIKESL